LKKIKYTLTRLDLYQKEELLDFIRKRLDEKRYIHSVNTAREAVKLAELYGADKEKAFIAGILHDIAKGMPAEKLLKISEENGIEVDEYEKNNAELMHGKIGSYIISKELGINNSDILSAVQWHTTGHADMSLLEKIIYLADIIEPGRTFKEIENIRKLAYENINKAMKVSLRESIDYVLSRGLTLHPKSIEAYEFLNKTEE
jgi:predicted HD superfamily hydrolase involved in NAD metabolism